MYCGNMTQRKENRNQFLVTFLKNRKFLRGLFLYQKALQLLPPRPLPQRPPPSRSPDPLASFQTLSYFISPQHSPPLTTFSVLRPGQLPATFSLCVTPASPSTLLLCDFLQCASFRVALWGVALLDALLGDLMCSHCFSFHLS